MSITATCSDGTSGVVKGILDSNGNVLATLSNTETSGSGVVLKYKTTITVDEDITSNNTSYATFETGIDPETPCNAYLVLFRAGKEIESPRFRSWGHMMWYNMSSSLIGIGKTFLTRDAAGSSYTNAYIRVNDYGFYVSSINAVGIATVATYAATSYPILAGTYDLEIYDIGMDLT